MKKSYSSLFVKSVAALALAAPMLASADSQLVIGNGTATANLNFRVVIPRVLLLQVGNASSVDLVEFNLDTAAVEPGAGGIGVDRTNGTTVPVRVLGNAGNISITGTASAGGLVNGTESIPWSEIAVSSSEPTTFPNPAVTGGVVNVSPTTGRVTNQTANWTFKYNNTVFPAEGTYSGSVVYTATML